MCEPKQGFPRVQAVRPESGKVPFGRRRGVRMRALCVSSSTPKTALKSDQSALGHSFETQCAVVEGYSANQFTSHQPSDVTRIYPPVG
eukprot:8159098-Pyramimonas_sp.AAC.2